MSTGTGQSDIIPLMQFNFEQQQGSLNDLSSHGIVGTLSNCQPVDDQDMGMCQRFDGSSSYVTCSPTVIHADTAQSSVFENGITITSWVKFDSFPSSGYSYLLQLVEKSGTGISFYTQGNKLNYWSKDKSTSCETSLVTGQWYHLAIAVDDEGNAQFFVDGQPSEQTTKTTLITPILNGPGSKQIIGAWQNANYFAGTMAWMAVYNGAYQQPGILTDLAKGESKRFTSFRQSFPVGFKLNSDDGGAESPILFIESQGEGKDLHLRLQNTGSTPINFYAPSTAVTKASGITDENYHAQLRFRPGILAENYIAENAIDTPLKLGSETGTNWLATLKKDPSGTYSMSFLYTGSSPLPIPPQGEELIIIKEVNASAAQGSRNTNVEFQYQNVLPGQSPVTIGTNATVPMEGHRVQNISIVNHAGVKDIPLRAEIIGPANVMTYSGASDVTPPESSLQFQLVNTGSKDLDLGLPSSADGATAFTLTIDVQPADYTAEWAMIDHGVASKLTLALSDGESGWNADTAGSVPTGNPNQLQWTITNQSANSFAQGEGLTFTLSGIECSLPAGSTVVTIGYRHIPGHWQGAFELPVTKSPVNYSRNGIGINTQKPKANLQIIERDNITPIEVLHAGTDLNALPAPTPLNTPVDNELFFMDNGCQNYFDNQFIKGVLTTDPVYIRIWTINGLGASQQSFNKVEVSGLSQKLDHQGTMSLASGFRYSAPYIYFSWSFSGGSYMSLYTYDASSQTTSFVSDCDIGTLIAHEHMVYHSGFAFCAYVDSSTVAIRTYDITQNPANKVQSLSLTSKVVDNNSDKIRLLEAFDGNLFYMISGNLYASSIGADGSLGSPYMVFDFNSNSESLSGNVVFSGNQLYCMASGSHVNIYAVDISNLASCTNKVLLQQIGAASSLAIREYCLLVLYDPKIDIYDLSKPNSGTLIKSLPTARTTSYRGIAGDYLWTHHYSSQTTNLYDIKSVINTLLGHGSYISSKSLSIGTPGLLDNATLHMPYPNGLNQNGLVIGNPDEFSGHWAGLSIGMAGDANAFPFMIFQAGNPRVVVNNRGWVGIGTNAPKAPLHVASTTNFPSVKNYAYLAGIPGNHNGKVGSSGDPQDTSIYTENVIQAWQFCAVDFQSSSDARIKDFIQPSAAPQDLATLLKLNVSNYQYIDIVKQGASEKKGLIAQEVNEVFPQAVNAEKTDFIPDIYAMATDLIWQQAKHQLEISLEKQHDLSVGDKVRLIGDQGFEEKEVVAVPNDQSFVVSEWEKPVDKLFVFGKEVHDFHTVDYDQVAMLGVSAIQALNQKVDSLEAENNSFRTELAEMREEMVAFKELLNRQKLH